MSDSFVLFPIRAASAVMKRFIVEILIGLEFYVHGVQAVFDGVERIYQDTTNEKIRQRVFSEHRTFDNLKNITEQKFGRRENFFIEQFRQFFEFVMWIYEEVVGRGKGFVIQNGNLGPAAACPEHAFAKERECPSERRNLR